MIDLKINQDLYFSERNIPISAMMGNLRLIGFGRVPTINASANTWYYPTFTENLVIYDSDYLEADSSNKLFVKQSAMYFFMVGGRLGDNLGTTQFFKIQLDDRPHGGTWSQPLYTVGGELTRETLFMWDGAYVEAGVGFTGAVNRATAGSTVNFGVYIFTTGEKIEKSDFPDDIYQKIEYLESNGTPYIETRLRPFTMCDFEIKFYAKSPVQTSSGYGCIFGTRNSSGVRDYQLTTYAQYSGGGSLRWGNSTDGSGSGNPKITQNTVQVCKMKNRTFTRNDGTTFTITGDEETPGYNLYLFGLNNAGTLGQTGSGCRIYYFKFWDNRQNLIGDFIPCRRKSDSVLGMYDTVTKFFYTNANSSGAFTAGPNV